MKLFPYQFIQTLTGSCGIRQGSALVLAVSGGPDSIALLHLMAGVQQQLELDITAVWVDHGLRPAETEIESKVTSAAARKLKIDFLACRVDVAAFAKEKHLSIEHAARDLRYEALRQAALDRKADCIAVAHTADDQTEEILLRLLRGSGRKGMAGMSMQSGDLIRPLLQIEKKVLLDWLQKENIAYCIDSSNTDLKFLRNRVRHQLLPFLEQNFDAGIRNSLRKTADSLAVDETLLVEQSKAAFADVVRENSASPEEAKILQLLRKPFSTLHPALQRRVAEQLLWQVGSRAGYDHILLILKAAATGRTHSELHLHQGLRVGIFHEYLEFSHPAGRKPWRGRLAGTRK